jgi:hypothetical protein
MLIDKLIKQVKSLELNLSGKTVLTEAATGAYVVTPIIAALAGAKVYAYSKTTRYGTVDEVFDNTRKQLQQGKASDLDIHFIKELTPEVISEADIITNSGHLRPLDKDKLKYAKDSVVIPLMYEAWEWRDADLDINYIRERGFKIGATNERHPNIDVFNYLGDMAVKQIFDAGLCPYKNKFVLICNNDFGPFIAKVVSGICDGLGVIDKPEKKHLYNLPNTEWLSDFPNIKIPEKYKDAEAIIFTAYPFDQNWIGENEPIKSLDIKNGFVDPFVLRYAGDVNCESLEKNGIRFFPEHVHSGHMGILPSAIGFDPIIRLQSGGLKVGEALLTGNHSLHNISLLEII